MTTPNKNVEQPDDNRPVSFSILAGGKEIDCSQYVISLTTVCEFHKIATAEIILEDGGASDADFSIGDADTFLIGEDIEVKLGYGDDVNSVFRGVVVKHSFQLSEGGTRLVITAKHKAYKMTLERCVCSYEEKTDTDIIGDICSKYGIAFDVEDTHVVHEKLIQYNCSDWDFINLRAEANGLLLFTSVEGITAKQPDVGAEPILKVENNYSISEIQVELDGRYAFESFDAKAWNYTSQELEEVSEEGSQFELGQGNLDGAKLSSLSSNTCRNIPILSSQENPDALESWTKAMVMRNNLSRIVGKIKIVGHASLKPADCILLEGIGKRFSGKTIISSVFHSIKGGVWSSLLNIGFDNTLFINRFDNVSPIPAQGALPAVNGLQIAKVEALEGDPLGEGRIYLRLMNTDGTKLWARVATLDAGNQRGSFFLPEIDDEVVVGFVDDNPNQAIILGMLHSSQSPPPFGMADANPIKGFVSREKIKLQFDDKKKSLQIETPGGNTLQISDEEKGMSFKDLNGNVLQMNAEGISIESKKSLTIKAVQGISIEGLNVEIKGNAQLKASGAAAAEISSGGSMVVKGALVKIN